MSIKQQIDSDLKTAMLAGDKTLTTTLRGVKAAILSVEINEGKRDTGLSDEVITKILSKEAKKRQESADMYEQGGNQEKAAAERKEKQIIQQYLPRQLSEEEVAGLVKQAINEVNATSSKDMGKVIGAVRAKAGSQADGALIARLVKESLES